MNMWWSCKIKKWYHIRKSQNVFLVKTSIITLTKYKTIKQCNREKRMIVMQTLQTLFLLLCAYRLTSVSTVNQSVLNKHTGGQKYDLHLFGPIWGNQNRRITTSKSHFKHFYRGDMMKKCICTANKPGVKLLKTGRPWHRLGNNGVDYTSELVTLRSRVKRRVRVRWAVRPWLVTFRWG